MAKGIRLAFAIAVGFVLAFAMAASAQTKEIKRVPVTPTSDISGEASFKAYCTVCHGAAAKGNGPAAPALKVPPADLTQIAKKNSGKFPALQVKMSLTGDTVVAAHGTRDMPMWGPVFRSVENSSVVELRLRNLVDYLEKIQEK